MSESTISCRKLQTAVYMITLATLNNQTAPNLSSRKLATAIAGAVGMYLASGLSLENWRWDRGVEVDSILRQHGVKRLVDLMMDEVK